MAKTFSKFINISLLFESYYLGDMFVNSTSAIPTVIVSNLPNNSFTSIFRCLAIVSWRRYVAGAKVFTRS